jgi:hypothetical protein
MNMMTIRILCREPASPVSRSSPSEIFSKNPPLQSEFTQANVLAERRHSNRYQLLAQSRQSNGTALYRRLKTVKADIIWAYHHPCTVSPSLASIARPLIWLSRVPMLILSTSSVSTPRSTVMVNNHHLKALTTVNFPDERVSLLPGCGGRHSVDCWALCAFAGPPFRAGAAVAARAGPLCGALGAGALVLSTAARNRSRRRCRPRFVRPSACAAVRIIRDTLVVVEDADVTLRVEDLGGRRRRISGGIDIDASVARVWHVLTQYGLMDKYMPNVVQSLTDVKNGQLYVDQVGLISRKLGLKTRMVMRVTETPSDLIAFSRVSGRDFSEFEGRYMFKPVSEFQMRLDYEVVAVPMPFFPVALVEGKIVKEVPGMLASVRGEAMYGRVIPL